MLTYAVLATMIDQFRGGAGRDLARMIKQGAIAIELLRPYHLLDKVTRPRHRLKSLDLVPLDSTTRPRLDLVHRRGSTTVVVGWHRLRW